MQVGNEHLKFQLRFVTSILKVRLEIADQYSLKVPRSWKTNTDWETIKVEETKGTYQLIQCVILDWILEQKNDITGKIDEIGISL